ncbi:FAD/NAD(P)-binding protein [Rhizobium sp. Leaf341]|uniref:FAD/NAD(P)-binding protein n=1 Tax=Rhizobium sp. Leaf341 TaxID=1736344 RepID=UPI000A7FB7E7|nr:FAD/NAD(P)-binding protein [Rhizobium sp. Leaf341]
MAYDVAIVGSGFSATAVGVHLLQSLPASASIAVVGDDPAFGRGTAYRTEFHLHRLNVPAGRMSLFPDAPDHFLQWLEQRGRGLSRDYFASRGDYGLYLRDTLASLLRDRASRARLDFIKAKATGCVSLQDEGLSFQLADGQALQARAVAVCLGVGAAGLPLRDARIADAAWRHIVRNPWQLQWLSKVKPEDTVCILGSGLTMIDQVLTLRARGHRGTLHVLSRRGLVPHAHTHAHAHVHGRQHGTPVVPDLPGDPLTASGILAALRAQVRKGADWRSVMDGLRPRTQALWQRLPAAERSRFLRHGLAWWNIHRHRLAPAVFARFDALIRDGQVKVHAGFLDEISMDGGRPCLVYRPRGGQGVAQLTADWVINCTGMERAGLAHSPLLTQMADQGIVVPDALGLGLQVDGGSRAVGRDGRARTGLYAVGALTAGQFWEITAVPDIRVQAQNVANAIAASVATTMPSIA